MPMSIMGPLDPIRNPSKSWQEKNKRDTDIIKEARIVFRNCFWIVFKKCALKQMILKDANNISRIWLEVSVKI